MLELLEMMQHFASVEGANVMRLRRGETTNRPAQVHEVGLDWIREWMHAALFGQAIALPRITRAARRDDVRPLVRAAARERNRVIARERLTMLELGEVASAVLTGIVIAREQKRVRRLPSEPTRHMNEL